MDTKQATADTDRPAKNLLTEENYRQSKKKLMRISAVILAVGVLIGGGLVAIGAINVHFVQKANEETAAQVRQDAETHNAQIDQQKQEAAEARSQKMTDAQSGIADTKEQIKTLKNEIATAEAERNQIFVEDKGFSDRYYAKDLEIKQKQQELSELQSQSSSAAVDANPYISGTMSDMDDMELDAQKMSDSEIAIEIAKKSISSAGYWIMIAGGIALIVVSGIVSLCLYLFGKRREITAFTTQQTMPVTQEVIEKMTPTIGNAAGEVAKGVANGIKTGLGK